MATWVRQRGHTVSLHGDEYGVVAYGWARLTLRVKTIRIK